jgi:hypothetical protein
MHTDLMAKLAQKNDLLMVICCLVLGVVVWCRKASCVKWLELKRPKVMLAGNVILASQIGEIEQEQHDAHLHLPAQMVISKSSLKYF